MGDAVIKTKLSEYLSQESFTAVQLVRKLNDDGIVCSKQDVNRCLYHSPALFQAQGTSWSRAVSSSSSNIATANVPSVSSSSSSSSSISTSFAPTSTSSAAIATATTAIPTFDKQQIAASSASMFTAAHATTSVPTFGKQRIAVASSSSSSSSSSSVSEEKTTGKTAVSVPSFFTNSSVRIPFPINLPDCVEQKEPSDEDVKKILSLFLRCNGRNWITAKELKKKLIHDQELHLRKKTVNCGLYSLEKDGKVAKHQTDKESSMFWVSCELEPTSIEEMEGLLIQMNMELLHTPSSVIKKQHLHDDIGNNDRPIELSVHYENDAVKSGTSTVNNEDYFRTKGSARLHSTPDLKTPNPLHTGESSLCLNSEIAKIRSYHDLLNKMSKGNILTEKQKKLCKARFIEAYNRGREWKVGDSAPFPESVWLEYKGMKDNMLKSNNNKWSREHFKKMFNDVAIKSLCAFVNYFVITRRRPLVPAKVVFGVTDEFKRIHGVYYSFANNEDLKTEIDALIESHEQRLRQALTTAGHVPSDMGGRIALALKIVVQRLEKPLDWLTMEVALLFTLELDFSHEEMEVCYPVMYKNIYYVRSEKPETRKATDEDLQRLFRGVPVSVVYNKEAVPVALKDSEAEYCEEEDCTEMQPCVVHPGAI